MKPKEVDKILVEAINDLIQMQERCLRCLKDKDKKKRVKFWFGSAGLIVDDEMASLKFSVKQLERLCDKKAKMVGKNPNRGGKTHVQ